MRILLIIQNDQCTDSLKFYHFQLNIKDRSDEEILKLLDKLTLMREMKLLDETDYMKLDDCLVSDNEVEFDPEIHDETFFGKIGKRSKITEYPDNSGMGFDKAFYFFIGM